MSRLLDPSFGRTRLRTVAPESWRILVSRRRQKIDSIVHHLCESVILPELIGFCCSSIRFIVFIDLWVLVRPSILRPAPMLTCLHRSCRLPLFMCVLFLRFSGLRLSPVLIIVVAIGASALPQIALIMLAGLTADRHVSFFRFMSMDGC